MARGHPYSRTAVCGHSDQYAFDAVVFASTLDPGFALLPNIATYAGFDLFVLVRVDNITYSVVADAGIGPSPLLADVVVSPTQTKLIMEAGSMQINLTFLNPIEPGDWIKQSTPFSYLSLTANSLNGAAHAVQVYSGLNATWSPGVTWNFNNGGSFGNVNNITYYAIESPVLYNGVPEAGLYSAMEAATNVSFGIFKGILPPGLFQNSGMWNTLSTNISEESEGGSFTNSTSATFMLSRDFGTIQATQDPFAWVFGYTADPVITYTDLSGTPQQLSSYCRTQYVQDYLGNSLITDLLNDFANASSRAQQLDHKILQDPALISASGSILGDMVSFATAQVYGSTQLAVAIDEYGQFNESDMMAFMQNMGGLWDTNLPYRVNAVETLYPAFPAFMYIDPKLGGILLESLFRPQASPKYTIPYAAPDLGLKFPNVTLSNSAHTQGVEVSGDMLIMTYAHARASGDDSLIIRYYSLLTSWADYLSNTTLLTPDQFSADGLSGANQTNLAIKGIIAIEAMSKMSSIVNQASNVDKYSSTAANLYAQWKGLALTSDQHLLAYYGRVDSWTLGYNLFADVWLGTKVVDSSVYDGQSSFLINLFTSNFSNPTYGMPVDNIGSYTVPAGVTGVWDMFVVAMTPNQGLFTNLISNLYSQGVQDVPWADETWYSPVISGPSPAEGAAYAPLALKVPVLIASPTTTGTPVGTPLKPHKRVVSGGAIGGIVGGVAALLAFGTIALVVRHRRRQIHGHTDVGSAFRESTNQDTQVTVTPFNPATLTPTEAAPPRAGARVDFPQRLFSRPFPPGDSPLSLRRMVSVPVGLSGKELARLRSNRLRSQHMDGRASYSPLTVTIDRDVLAGAAASPTSPSEAWGQSENNFSRHEMPEVQQLLVERSESPPSYVSRPQGSNMF
ncbi:protein of unknown function (DUF1793) domain containing protein [Lactarius tabidus]